MKSVLISLITFVVGLLAGMLGQSVRVDEENPAHASEIASSKDAPVISASASQTGTQTSAALSSAASSRDPFAEWSAALLAGKLNDARLRHELLDSMIAADPERAWRELMTSHLRVTVGDVERIARGWQAKDPLQAVTFGLKLTDPLLRPAFLRQALTHWFLEKPQAFAQWFASAPQAENLVHHLNWSNMVYHPGATTLEDLESLMQVSPPYGSFPSLVANGFCEVWRQPKQREAAMDWLQGLEDGEVRDATWKQLVEEVSKDDPRAAAELIEEIRSPQERREASSTVAAHLAQTDPEAALAYAAELTDENARAAAWQSALGTWAKNDVSKALAFVRANQDSIAPDLLVPMAGVLAAKAPVEALEMAAGFSVPERSTLINSLMGNWMSEFPLDAKKWLASDQAAILPSADLERLRTQANASSTLSVPTSHTTTVNGRRVSYSY